MIARAVYRTTEPVKDVVTELKRFDVSIRINTIFTHYIKKENNVFAYNFQGKGLVDERKDKLVNKISSLYIIKGKKLKLELLRKLKITINLWKPHK
ncbi:MAG: hypothetical protein ACTSSG_06530 [Candidatus Heimdallarchaeaceae archaeon]